MFIRKKRTKRRQSDGALGHLLLLNKNEVSADDLSTQFSSEISLSDEQAEACKAVKHWLDAPTKKPALRLGGYAGTGKTTLLGYMANQVWSHLRVAYCTPTGKAAGVLKRSLNASGVRPEYCGTIHRLLYRPEFDEGGNLVEWKVAEELPYDMVVVDEASMLSSEVRDDLLAMGVPVLAVGDHGQLPPVGEESGWMSEPDIALETVRRQALDSPVLWLANAVRSGMPLSEAVAHAEAMPRGMSTVTRMRPEQLARAVTRIFSGAHARPLGQDPLVLCGMNKTRASINAIAREAFAIGAREAGHDMSPNKKVYENERVMVLKNAYLSGMLLANGTRGVIEEELCSLGGGHKVKVNAVFPEENLRLMGGVLCVRQLGAERTFATWQEASSGARSWEDAGLLFDYGYASTVHKAQGSQADNALVYVERLGSAENQRRWLYTAITRCSKNLVLVF